MLIWCFGSVLIMPIWCFGCLSDVLDAYLMFCVPHLTFCRTLAAHSHLTFCRTILGITQTSSNLRYHTPFSITVRASISVLIMPIWCFGCPSDVFDAHLMFWMPIWCFVFPSDFLSHSRCALSSDFLSHSRCALCKHTCGHCTLDYRMPLMCIWMLLYYIRYVWILQPVAPVGTKWSYVLYSGCISGVVLIVYRI